MSVSKLPLPDRDRLVPSPLGSPARPLLNPTVSNAPHMRTHAGCVLCGLVASAAGTNTFNSMGSEGDPTPPPSAATTSFLYSQSRYNEPFGASSSATGSSSNRRIVNGREIVYQDEDITVYSAEGKERLCSGGRHLIIVVNRHLESVYDFSAADVPLLSHILATAEALLLPLSSTSGTSDAEGRRKMDAKDIRVGFVGSVMKDPQSPHAHLHAHAMLGPIDTTLPGATFWRRTVVFGGVNWWSVDDLRAEIREETSNNRVKSGYTDRGTAPIDKVPDAGSTSGLPNALDPDPYIDSPAGPPTVSLPPSNAPASRKMSSRPTDSRQPLEAVNSLQLNRMSYDRYDAVDLQSTPAIR